MSAFRGAGKCISWRSVHGLLRDSEAKRVWRRLTADEFATEVGTHLGANRLVDGYKTANCRIDKDVFIHAFGVSKILATLDFSFADDSV